MYARFVENEEGLELDPNDVVKKYACYAGWFVFFARLLMVSAILFGASLLFTLVYVFEKPTGGNPALWHEITVWFAKLTGILGLLSFVFGFARWRYGKLIDEIASAHWVIRVGPRRADYLVNYNPRWTINCARQLPMIFPFKSVYFSSTGKVEWDATFTRDSVATNLHIVVEYDLWNPKLDQLLQHFPSGRTQMEDRIISDVNLGLYGRVTANEELVIERQRILWPPENPFIWLNIKVAESEANAQTVADTPVNWLTNDAEFRF